MKTSNKFTTMRVVFAPIFFLIYAVPLWVQSPLLYKISAVVMIPLLALFELTDFFDGYYARKNGEVSDFGKLYDPFADVMLNLTVFLCATKSVEGGAYMPLVIFALILYREFSMNFIRMVAASKGTAIAARKGGKLKTVFYIISGFFMLAVESLLRWGIRFAPDVMTHLHIVAAVLFSICLVLSYCSFIDYIRTFYSLLKNGK